MGKFSSGVLFPDQEWDALRDVDRETVANRAPAFQSTRLSDVEGVSVRLLNCFSKVGVETLGALLAMSDDDVLRIPHLGMKTLGEVRELRGRYSAVSGEV